MTERELGKVSLKIIITSHCAVSSDNQKLLIFRPAKTLNGAFVPVDSADQFAGTTIDIYTRLRSL
jgi:hypothetical protein